MSVNIAQSTTTLSITLDQLHYNSIGIANGLYIILKAVYLCIILITKIVSFTIDKTFSFSQKQDCNIFLARLIVIIAIVCSWTKNFYYNQVSVIYQRPFMVSSTSIQLPLSLTSASHHPPLNKSTAMNHFVMVCFIVC